MTIELTFENSSNEERELCTNFLLRMSPAQSDADVLCMSCSVRTKLSERNFTPRLTTQNGNTANCYIFRKFQLAQTDGNNLCMRCWHEILKKKFHSQID